MDKPLITLEQVGVQFGPQRVLHGIDLQIQRGQTVSRLLGGHRVDLVSEKYLNPRLRGRVLASAEVQYAEG